MLHKIMVSRLVFFSLFCLVLAGIAKAQVNPLPEFSLKAQPRNSVLINWVNNFGDECVQLNVQRSGDSVLNFTTIYSAPAPNLPTNGYLDKEKPDGRVFYRIFYMLSGGAYFFTASKPAPLPLVTAADTRDSGKLSAPSTLVSSIVSIDKLGNIVIKLPGAKTYNYSMLFFQPGDSIPLFRISKFENQVLTLDKSVFLRAGIYNYELYESGKLIEKKDFQLVN